MFTGLTNVTDVSINTTTAIARIGEGSSAIFKAVGNNSAGQVYGDPTKATTAPVHEWQTVDLSNVVTPDPTSPDPATETVLPPTNISAAGTTDNFTKISWVAPAADNIDAFHLAICAKPDGSCTVDSTNGFVQGDWSYIVRSLRQTSLGVSGVQPDTAVHIRLRSVSFNSNVSAWTDEFIVRTLP
mgnify:CR=1 FL=1